MRLFTIVVVAVALTASAVVISQQPMPRGPKGVTFGGPFVVGELQKGDVDEASGIAASKVNTGLLWLINDSGDEARVYGINSKGAMQCTLSISNGKNVDWEDIAVGPGPESGVSYLYLGDIGDNQAQRSEITVYRTPEPRQPKPSAQTVTADVLTFTYPDGARDAEALLVDPITQDLYIVTKRERKARVYRAAAPHQTGTKRTLEFVGEIPHVLITGGDISSNGKELILKDYVYCYYWQRKDNETIAQLLKRPATKVSYMPEPQGEAVCFSASGDGYYTISERPDTMWATRLYYYGRAQKPTESELLRDAKTPTMSLAPSRDTDGIFDLRYVVPDLARIRISVHNVAMMKIEDVEENASEAGVQEREVDMIDKPEGTYVVVLRAGSGYNAMAVEIKK